MTVFDELSYVVVFLSLLSAIYSMYVFFGKTSSEEEFVEILIKNKNRILENVNINNNSVNIDLNDYFQINKVLNALIDQLENRRSRSIIYKSLNQESDIGKVQYTNKILTKALILND